MECLDFWRLCDELTVIQAALLILGEDPAVSQHVVEQRSPEERPLGFDAAYAALKNAINGGRLQATIRREACKHGWTEDPPMDKTLPSPDEAYQQISYKAHPDWGMTTITIDNLREWLAGRGIKTGFFFPQSTDADAPDYLDTRNPRYAPKLAAAVRAWEATGDESAVAGRSPKKALEKYLREHAHEFGLTDKKGNPNETGIEEVAKVANWQLSGGAPKTPGG